MSASVKRRTSKVC